MNCPKCRERQMQPESSNDIEYLRCAHCQGMVYEQTALERVLREGRGTRDSLAFSVQSDMMDSVAAHCFDCERDMVPIMKNGVRIDQCEGCLRVFLDEGEMASLIFAR